VGNNIDILINIFVKLFLNIDVNVKNKINIYMSL
jgi:hypothetical protein